MDFNKAHQGQHRQTDGGEEAEAQEEAGATPGINPDLHAPEVDLADNRGGINLHGDVPGSPYSSNPGEISLTEAAQQAARQAEAGQQADDADTRAREVESRQTGVPTETLAAEDEAEGEKPAPKSKRSGGKK